MIRPFQLGDLFLVHRLGRQATKLNAIQSLLYPRSATMAALGSLIPGMGGNVSTYVLRQNRNTLVHAGLIQVQKRTGRPEADILLLAPALDTPRGHPVIWEKLLSYYAQEAARQRISRIFVDVPDQPLLVNTFSQVGFKLYTRQTIWRLSHHHSAPAAHAQDNGYDACDIRSDTPTQDWDLLRLYTRITPEAVQRAEGAIHTESEREVKPLILDWWQSSNFTHFVLVEEGEVRGCMLIGRSSRGYWMRLLVDTLQPDTHHIQCLLRHGLRTINTSGTHLPIYIGVRDYHGGMSSILSSYGFAPFTDRARMVRHVPAWARQTAFYRKPAVETVGEAVPTSFVLPKAAGQSTKAAAHRIHPLPHECVFTPSTSGFGYYFPAWNGEEEV